MARLLAYDYRAQEWVDDDDVRARRLLIEQDERPVDKQTVNESVDSDTHRLQFLTTDGYLFTLSIDRLTWTDGDLSYDNGEVSIDGAPHCPWPIDDFGPLLGNILPLPPSRS